MKKLKILILSWLVFHANRLGKNFYFYQVKNKLLCKYGSLISIDFQFIEGKKCYSCDSTGIYHSDYKLPEMCWSCMGTGMYKNDQWNVLNVYELGKYKFHQPRSRMNHKPNSSFPVINGYIKHSPSKYSDFALFVLLLVYDKGFLKRWYKESETWCFAWYLPKNWIPNFIHILKYRLKSYPIRNLKQTIRFTFQSGPSGKFESSD